MIKVTIRENNNNTDSIIITGHAGYDKFGKDIVCAAVSSITITTINAILRIDSDAIDYKQTEDLLIIIKNHNHIIDILIQNMIDLLKQLEQDYNKNIKINREVS